MTRAEEFRQLYVYNRWANALMLDAAANLTDEQFTRDMRNSFRSIRDTLVHIMSAEWVWLSRWTGTSPTAMPEAWKSFTLDDVRRGWSELDRRLQAFVASVEDDAVDVLVSYRNIAGEPFTTPLSQMLRHVINHSTYHRGQITTMLRQLGAVAPSTDLIVFYRSLSPEAPRSISR